MIPKKKKGFRKIIVGNTEYNWRFSGIVEIRPKQNVSNKLEIDMGHFDPWLYVNDLENKPDDFEPKTVTPGFVKKCIEAAISSGWDIGTKNTHLKLSYKKGEFL
ncbi:hypothetical protein NAT51_08210 [Flavobacterium amniphilum]|uniref:hypothetical protein n=1 Tax=Flavobacterium amniphilum TaxID=1834035 RepID=UPI002029C102|nr:hypothetical protein [Flavobacterium amniphilum]MCL9805502.1 hypothetical protein [Flavobacterium amniphilum]